MTAANVDVFATSNYVFEVAQTSWHYLKRVAGSDFENSNLAATHISPPVGAHTLMLTASHNLNGLALRPLVNGTYEFVTYRGAKQFDLKAGERIIVPWVVPPGTGQSGFSVDVGNTPGARLGVQIIWGFAN